MDMLIRPVVLNLGLLLRLAFLSVLKDFLCLRSYLLFLTVLFDDSVFIKYLLTDIRLKALCKRRLLR